MDLSATIHFNVHMKKKEKSADLFSDTKAILHVREYNIKSTRIWPFFALSDCLPAINDIFHRQELHTIVQTDGTTKYTIQCSLTNSTISSIRFALAEDFLERILNGNFI